MWWVPMVGGVVGQLAEYGDVAPVSETAVQPVIGFPPSKNSTLPVGATEPVVTVVEYVMGVPSTEGLEELVGVEVLVAPFPTTRV